MIRLNKTTIFGIVIFVIMLFTGIGYAFLSSNLSVNGTAGVAKRKIICKRATSLHSEMCSYANLTENWSCGTDGYTENSSRVYFGKLGTSGTLSAGDAFDCDVNGDGTYNSTNERFYYVTDLETDSSYAVLIFYTNIASSSGAQSTSKTYTYSGTNNTILSGPTTAKDELPYVDTWGNVRLSNTTRNITDDSGKVFVQNFKYEHSSIADKPRTSRLLTFKELVKVCPGAQVIRGKHIKSGNCEYLVEGTQYTNASYTKGYWLEDVYPSVELESDSYNKAWAMDGKAKSTYPIYGRGYDSNDKTSQFGLRPVIEVKKGQIEY